MDEQMTNLKCRKCGAPVTIEQKKCQKCGAPVLLKIMMEEEKRHLSAKEIREKDKRMRHEYMKLSEEKNKRKQKEEKKQEKEQLKSEREALKKQKQEYPAQETGVSGTTDEKKAPLFGIISIILVIIIVTVSAILLTLPKHTSQEDPDGPAITETESDEKNSEEPEEDAPEEETESAAEIPAAEQAEEPPEEETPHEEAPAQETPAQEVPQAEEPAPKTESATESPKHEEKPASSRKITKNNYLFPSDTEKLTESDLSGLSKYDTGLIRNEIYARKGYIFKSEPYKSYFNSQKWYDPKTTSQNLPLNSTEKYNLDFLMEYERSQGWR